MTCRTFSDSNPEPIPLPRHPINITFPTTFIMRHLSILAASLLLYACNPATESSDKQSTNPEDKAQQTAEVRASVVRINSTQQAWSQWQPWEKQPPSTRRALGAIVGDQQVITTAELVTNATYIEFESADGTRFTEARVIARDDDANLVLLAPADPEQGSEFFSGTIPFELAAQSRLGDTLEILQLEANGTALKTPGSLQSVDLTSSFMPGQHFLTYLVKASMQSAASSYSLPVIKGDKLAGVLLSYSSKDQICDVLSTDIINRFLEAAKETPYVGFPGLGVQIALTEDKSFRQWLKLGDDQGGLYIQGVRKGSAADKAGLEKGDVILKADGHPIDRRGYYEHPHYGSLSWIHLVRGEKRVGEPIKLSILRQGEEMEITATMSREHQADKLVPSFLFEQQPNYLVKGGLIFQELTLELLQRYGKDWKTRAPLNLLDAHENPESLQKEMDRVIFLSSVIPTPATIGYERLRNLLVRKVNGKPIRNMSDLIEAFEENGQRMHSIEFVDEHIQVYLDNNIATAVDNQLLGRGITKLYHVESTAAQDE